MVERLKRSAVVNRRSINSEIIARLKARFHECGQSALEAENNSSLKTLCAKLDVQSRGNDRDEDQSSPWMYRECIICY
ncbi:Arc family DNA-binding protein [Pseudomonas syringae]